MASLLSPSTVYHNSLQQQFSVFQSHSPLFPLTNEKLNLLASPSKRRSVFAKKRQLGVNAPKVPTADAAVNIIDPDDREAENKEPKSMVNLIALKLQPPTHKGMSFLGGNVKISTTVPPSTSLSTSLKRPSRALDMTPSVQEQWRLIMEEVKKLFGKRQYTKCSSRCRHILDSLTQPSQHHALHLVYLCFYCALALEQTAKSHHNDSLNKRAIFLESLEYLQKALSTLPSAALISTAKTSCHTDSELKSKRNFVSSPLCSNRSSIDSVFSQVSSYSICSDASSRPLTPQENDKIDQKSHRSSFEIKSTPFRVQKRVSFAQKLPALISQVELSFEGENDEPAMIDSFPFPPPTPPLSAQPKLPFADRQRRSSFGPDITRDEESASITPTSQASPNFIIQYQRHSQSFSCQLRYHIQSIHAQIEILSKHELLSRKEVGDTAAAADETEGSHKAELLGRIKRLKSQGWARKQFDASRYQDLCERAIAEIDEYY